jgi:hypothetical protein
MARRWTSRQAPPPTSLTEIARRYHAAAVVLAQTLGLSVPEVLSAHRESVTAIFIECGRCDLRLPAAVKLPPLTGDTPPVATPHGNSQAGESICTMTLDPEAPVLTHINGHTPPTIVPKDSGLPCGGVLIGDLKPAQLAMLVSKTAALVHAEGERWVPLLGALQVERARRLEKGRKLPRPDLDPVGHVEVEEG